MTKARCPVCNGLFGPLVNDLLMHLKVAHDQVAEWYDASSGTVKLRAWLPGTLEFVEEDESA